MRIHALVPMALLTMSSAGCSHQLGIDGDFELQSYELPDGQGYRHMTAFINEEKKELVLFGGLGNGPPLAPTPMNHKVYTLDLTKPASQRFWKRRTVDDAVERPWFTSTRGFVEVDGKVYLTCDDTDQNAVYELNPRKYAFKRLSTSTLAPEINAGDCCAVGVKVEKWRRGRDKGDVRIYIMGGRNASADAVGHVRYYSVTDDRWEQVSGLNVARSHLGCAAANVHDAPAIYAIGGGNSTTGTALRSMEIYDVVRDTWTLHEDFLPQGRTRLAVQNIDDKALMLIGGDASCAGGGANNLCTPDHPLTNVDLVEIARTNRFISGVDNGLPQLITPRQTPATALRKKKGKVWMDSYELHVVAGRTIAGGALGVATSTEALSFDLFRGWNLP